MASTRPLVLVTGATGLLGREVVRALVASDRFDVAGTSLSRTLPGVPMHALDLSRTDEAAAASLMGSLRPAVVIHAAAERRPDVCESKPSESETINVVATWNLARATAAVGGAFILIGSDYVFDGTAPPYCEDAVARPLNAYGMQKLRAEWAARAAHPSAIVLRVPVLYGPSTDWKESAVTSLVYPLLPPKAAPGTPLAMDDWQIRVPTLTSDIGAVLVNMAQRLTTSSGSPPLSGIFHYSAPDTLTRFALVNRMAALLDIDASGVTAVAAPPPGAPRPRDAQLSCDRLKAAGLWVEPTPLDAGLTAVLGMLRAA